MAKSCIDPSVTRSQLLELGEKLGAGLRHLTGSGEIEVNPTPRRLVHERDKIKLYQYSQSGNGVVSTSTPLLIVYALVNRPYMLDLEADRSMIANLVDKDICTYLLDWGYPDASDQFLTLEDYIFDYLDEAIGGILS